VNALNGKAVEAHINTKLVEVTKDNLSDPQVAQYLYKAQC
jgi:hypothetical protein